MSFPLQKYSIGVNQTYSHDIMLPSFTATPQFLAETKYANPSNITSTPFQLGHHTKLTFFEYLAKHPEQAQQFNNFMGLYATDRPRWLDEGHFPVRDILGKGASTEENAVLLVDVGGGKGHDLILFQKRYGDLPGRMVLQDLPSVVEQAGQLPEGLEATGHDFFKENPIKGMIISNNYGAVRGRKNANMQARRTGILLPFGPPRLA